MIIRDYFPGDREECIEIFISNVPKFFAAEELEDFKGFLNGRDSAQLAYNNTESEYYFVVELDDEVVGCGGFYIPRDDSNARFVWGMIKNSYHLKGIGKVFLEYRLNKIRLLKPNAAISLDTTQHTFKFFEKFGFTTTKVQKDFYAKGLDRYDMVF
ncbi:MAG: GNAT family N-acetyltransferase [Bacteroidota bacterium]|nr:GNAT family N-acetyltransferase [Bacteroidota bacterium]